MGPKVNSISPLLGMKSGNTLLTINGSGFQPGGISSNILCIFGDKAVVAKLETINGPVPNEEVTCKSPASTHMGSVPFYITVGIDRYLKSPSFYFHYVEDFAVHSISPESYDGGSVEVSLLGDNFLETEAIVCRFGSVDVRANYVEKREITCASPSRRSGDLPIYLSFDGQHFEDTGLFLNYVPISNETSVTQVSVQTFATELIGGSFEKGPSETTWLPVINQTFFAGVSTNSTLTVTGDNFLSSSNLMCRFDSLRSTAIWISRFQIECVAPKYPTRFSELSVSNNGIDFVKS